MFCIAVNAGLTHFWPRILNDQEFLAAMRNCRDSTLHGAWEFANLENRQNESCETYLAMVLTNPLSLKQLSRIQIRNMLVERMKDFDFVKTFIMPKRTNASNEADNLLSVAATTPTAIINTTNWITTEQCHGSILAILISQLELPISLKRYLYEFPDVPLVPLDLDVFV